MSQMIFPTERVQNGVFVLAKLLHRTRSLGPLQKQASNPESKAKQVLSKKAGEAKAAKEQTNKQRNKETKKTVVHRHHFADERRICLGEREQHSVRLISEQDFTTCTRPRKANHASFSLFRASKER